MKNIIVEEIANILGISSSDVKIEYPKDRSLGDYAIPCFPFSKLLHKNPNEIAEMIQEKLSFKSNVVNGYLNIFMDKKKVTKDIIELILKEKKLTVTTVTEKVKIS